MEQLIIDIAVVTLQTVYDPLELPVLAFNNKILSLLNEYITLKVMLYTMYCATYVSGNVKKIFSNGPISHLLSATFDFLPNKG